MKTLPELNEELERVRAGLGEVGRELSAVVEKYRAAEAREKIALAVHKKDQSGPQWLAEAKAVAACKAEVSEHARLRGKVEELKNRKDIGMAMKDTIVMEASVVKAIDLELLKGGSYGA
jgi:hypothetical protein